MSEVKATQMDAAVQMYQMKMNVLMDTGLDLVNRSFVISGEIDEDTFKLVDAFMSMLEIESKAAVTVKISSGGGSVYAAMAIITRLRSSKCKIITEGYGFVASAAFNILAAGHKRRISPIASVMHHEASINGDVTMKTSELKAFTVQMTREERSRAELMARFTNQPVSFWLEEGSKTDRYFTTNELLEFGVVDEVIKL